MNTGVAVCYVSSDGEDWATYIKATLVSQPYEINCELVDVSSNSHTKDVDALQQSKVNVFFITPNFLEHSGIKLLLYFEKDTTVIVLAGVEREDLDMAVPDFKDIFTDSIICDLQQTEESVRDLLITIISVFENDESPISTPVFDIGDEDHYSVLPKPRQVNALHQVFFKDDKVYVLLDRPADGNLIFNVDGHEAIRPQCTEFAVYWFPFKGLTSATITVFQENNKLGESELNVQANKTDASSATLTEIKACVPKSFKDHSTQTNTLLDKNFEIIPGSAQDISDVRETCPPPQPCVRQDYKYVNITHHSKNIDISSKTEPISPVSRTSKLDKIRDLLESETNPMQLLCDCLHIEKKDELLDKMMASMVECSETFKHLSYSRTDCHEENCLQSTWPTLVRFGAQYNLINFCELLLRNPLTYKACVRANKDGYLPHDLARLHGHTELADMLQQCAEFVRANKDGKNDGGFSLGSVGMPPSSTTTHYIDTLPIPYRHINNEFKLPNGSWHEDDSDEYCADDFDDSNGFVKVPISRNDVVDSSMRQQTPQGEHQTYNNTGNVKQEIIIEKHKDIAGLLGMLEVTENPIKGRGGILTRFFKAKKTRSKSDTSSLLDSPKLQRKGAKAFTHDTSQHSTRSSGTSSSTTSTYSNESCSTQNKDDEEFEHVEKNNSEKKKAKNKMRKVLTNSKNRKSIRIKHAVDDKNLAPLHIPLKKSVHTSVS